MSPLKCGKEEYTACGAVKPPFRKNSRFYVDFPKGYTPALRKISHKLYLRPFFQNSESFLLFEMPPGDFTFILHDIFLSNFLYEMPFLT